MKLYIMRHGIATSAEVDPQRPLTVEGRAEVQKIASNILNANANITQIIHSGILRAKQTAEIVANTLNVADMMESPELLTERGSINAVLEILPSWHQTTLLVGHLPFVYQLVNALVMSSVSREPIVDFTPATIVCLNSFAPKRWMIQSVISPESLAN